MKRVVVIQPAKSGTAPIKALLESVKRAGYQLEGITDLTAPEYVEPIVRGCEFAISYGMRHQTAAGRYACANYGVPCLIGDLGYMRRAKGSWDSSGYFQYGWNRIGWVPPGEHPSDRFDRLNIKVLEKRASEGRSILVAGQVGGDGQHNMTSNQMSKWLVEFVRRKILYYENRMVVYRPHPVTPHTVLGNGLKVVHQNPLEVSANDALDDAEYLLTYNSTLGVEAMIRAVPVMCSPKAHYHDVAEGTFGERLAYLHRLAYGQWTQEEAANGTVLDFLLQHIPHAERID